MQKGVTHSKQTEYPGLIKKCFNSLPVYEVMFIIKIFFLIFTCHLTLIKSNTGHPLRRKGQKSSEFASCVKPKDHIY